MRRQAPEGRRQKAEGKWTSLVGVALLATAAAGCSRPLPVEPAPDAQAAMQIRETLVAAAPAEGTAEAGGGAAAEATGWATLKGRFIYAGTAPQPARIDIAGKDPEVCGKHPLYNESLVVGSDGGLANVAIWVRGKNPPVHPDYEQSANDKVVLDNLECKFVPHVAAMRAGQTLEVKNSDATGHNTNAALRANAPFNVVIPANSATDQSLASSEPLPAPVTCNIHPWMKGYLLVVPHPYFAVTAKDGTFEMKNVPAGVPLEIQVWHEASTSNGAVQADRADLKWQSNGRFTLTLQPDEVFDLKEIQVPAAALAAQ